MPLSWIPPAGASWPTAVQMSRFRRACDTLMRVVQQGDVVGLMGNLMMKGLL